MFCEHCGKQIDNDSKFCVCCGQTVQPLQEITRVNQESVVGEPQKSKKKKWWIIPVIASAILCVAIVTGILIYNSPASKTKRYLNDARVYLDEMDYAQAIATYKKIIEIDPKNADAYFGLAEAYEILAEQSHNLDTANEYYRQASMYLASGISTTDEDTAYYIAKQENLEGIIAKQTQNADETRLDVAGVQAEDISMEEDIESEDPVADAVLAIMDAKVGDSVFFGRYEVTKRKNTEDESGWDEDKDPMIYCYNLDPPIVYVYPEKDIEWIVVKNDDEGVLLLSKYILDTQPFNKYKGSGLSLEESNYWSESYIRQWLNNDFYNRAFNSAEQAMIAETFLENRDRPGIYNDTPLDAGPDTADKVFIFSVDEIEEYFGVSYLGYETSEILRAKYAEGDTVGVLWNGTDNYDSPYTPWLLRSPNAWDTDYDGDSYVTCEGSSSGEIWECAYLGIRPAIVIKKNR